MHTKKFTPQIKNTTPEVETAEAPLPPVVQKSKPMSLGAGVCALICGALPFLFIPGTAMSAGYTRTVLLLLGITICMVCIGIAAFSVRRIPVRVGLGLWVPAAFAALLAISFFAVSDVRDSLAGTFLAPTTYIVTAALALLTIMVFLFSAQRFFVRAVFSVSLGAMLLMAIVQWSKIIAALVWKAPLLTFLPNASAAMLGSWNSVGIFAGVLVAVIALMLTRPGVRVLSLAWGGVAIFGLLSLLVLVNIPVLWWLLFAVSLGAAGWYYVSGQQTQQQNIFFGGFAALMLAFLFFGPWIGGVIVQRVSISNVEFFPSLQSTTNIVGQMIDDGAWLGVGPAQFTHAWQQYKDPSIMVSAFWNTDFYSAFGYVTTLWVEYGIAGVLATLLLFGTFVYGVYVLLRYRSRIDPQSFRITLIAAIATVFIFIALIFCVPTIATIALLFICLGSFFGLLYNCRYRTMLTIDVQKNKTVRLSVRVVGLALVVGGLVGMLSLYNNYTALATYEDIITNEALTTDEIKQSLLGLYGETGDDYFLLQYVQLAGAHVSALLSIPEPTEENTTEAKQAIAELRQVATLLAEVDTDEPGYAAAAAEISVFLAELGAEGEVEKGLALVEQAQSLYPLNPQYDLLTARLRSASGDTAASKAAIATALEKKPNFAPAYLYLTDMAVANKEYGEAVIQLQQLLSFDPQNVYVYYQLALLHIELGEQERAMEALQTALTIEPENANAAYTLALLYLQAGNETDALTLLRAVAKNNPDNEQLQQLIASVEDGTYSATAISEEAIEEESTDADSSEESASLNDAAATDAVTSNSYDSTSEAATQQENTTDGNQAVQ